MDSDVSCVACKVDAHCAPLPLLHSSQTDFMAHNESFGVFVALPLLKVALIWLHIEKDLSSSSTAW